MIKTEAIEDGKLVVTEVTTLEKEDLEARLVEVEAELITYHNFHIKPREEKVIDLERQIAKF